VVSTPQATLPLVEEKTVAAASMPAAEKEKITPPSASPATEAPGKSEAVSSTADAGSQRSEPEPLVETAPGKPALVGSATPPKEPKRQPLADVTATDTPVGWFDAAPTNHFTAQLIGSRNPDSLERFVSKNGLGDGAELLRTRRDGADWFFIVYGDFPDRGAAKIGIERLPAAARKNKPWVRTIGEVRKLLARD
jgi:DamX protein